MMTWVRTSQWRQGSFVDPDVTEKLCPGSTSLSNATSVGVIISHDCDIAASEHEEPAVEVIVGRLIEETDGNYTAAKSSRKLHILATDGSKDVPVELRAQGRYLVSKAVLASYVPSESYRLGDHGRRILQQWLASRYRRSAFPDAFDRALKANNFWERLRKIIKPSGEFICGILCDLTEPTGDLDDDGIFALGLNVVFASEPDYSESKRVASKVRDAITKVFEQQFCDQVGRWRIIELAYCEAISDDAVSLRQSQVWKRLNLDDLSLREVITPPQLDC